MEVAEAGRESPRHGARNPATLDEQISYLTALFEQSPVGLAFLDPDLRYAAVNPALSAMNGLPVEAHLGRRVPELLPDLDSDVELVLRRVLETGEPLIAGLVRGRVPGDGSRDRVWEASYYRLGGPDGRPLGVSMSIQDVTAREEGRRAVVAAQFRLSVVNEATARIGTTLDLDRTCRELVEVAAPRFADLATVDLLASVLDIDAMPVDPVDGSAAVRRIAARSTDHNLEDAVLHPVGSRVVYGPAHPGSRALARGRAVLVRHLDTALVERSATSSREAAFASDARLASLITAPLIARGQVLGVAGFARTSTSTPFDEQDLAIAEELAIRAGLAIDNARLFNRERTTALALQRALLPQGSPHLACVDVASRYQPGSIATEVGGDWFDVVPLSCGRVALVVGDVMGRGLRAAAAMGQLRTAVRTLAVLDLMPDDVMAHLDHVAQSLDAVQLATCVYAVYDPVSRHLNFASAGHPPPVLMYPDRTVELLETPSGAPLGVGGVPFETAEVTLPDGSTLALYTDGLVESRLEELDDGLERLKQALAVAPEPMEELCDFVLHSLGRDRAHDDDVALLAARVAGVAHDRTEAWTVPADLAAVSQARHVTTSTLHEWDLSALDDSATLLVSEIVTNAVRYARGPIVLRLVKLDNVLVCSVLDGDTRLPRLRRASFEDEGGRGLHLVGMLAHRWGARPTSGGKSVWFELLLPNAPAES